MNIFETNRKIIIAAILSLCITIIGTTGYVLIEDFSLFEGFYMTVITLSSVGFGEVKELSSAGRLFTSILIMVGIGVLAFTAHALIESLIENTWKGKRDEKKMKKRLSDLKSHFIICGYGRVGAAAAGYFEAAGTPFAIIEKNPGLLEKIKEKGFPYVEGDATRESLLREAGIKEARGILALLSSDPDNLFIVLSARELNPILHIVARAEDPSSEKKIHRAGADRVVSPFATAGRQIASDLLGNGGKSGQLDGISGLISAVPRWISIEPGSSMINQSISSVAAEMGREIIGLRRKDQDSVLPDLKVILQSDDQILVLDDEQADETESADRPKVVIVDDNPIILRLYTRLFKQRGFLPVTASDGGEGLEVIIREKPVAAVIDYMLPVMSGIDICRRLREMEENQEMKLILFTSDEKSETHRLALEAGADGVVVKSSDSSEIIDTVISSIRTAQEG